MTSDIPFLRICLYCDINDFWLNSNAEIEQEYKGETFKIVTPAMECRMCGWRTMSLEQVDVLRKLTVEAYNERMGLKPIQPL